MILTGDPFTGRTTGHAHEICYRDISAVLQAPQVEEIDSNDHPRANQGSFGSGFWRQRASLAEEKGASGVSGAESIKRTIVLLCGPFAMGYSVHPEISDGGRTYRA